MNRKIAIFLFLVLGCSTLLAQKFGDGNPVWNYSIIPSWGNYDYHGGLSVQKDTIFKNKTCKILARHGRYISYLPFKKMFCQDSSRVLIWSEVKQEFQILYDFKAKKGDTWSFWLDDSWNNSTNDSINVLVDSSYKLSVNGRLLNAQIVEMEGMSSTNSIELIHGKFLIIERVGNTSAMIPVNSREADADFVNGLICYTDDSLEYLLSDISNENCRTVGLETNINEENLTRIYPNPNNGHFITKIFEYPIDQILFYNLQGKSIDFQFVKYEHEIEINLKGAIHGLYVMKIILANGATENHRIEIRH